VKATVELGKHVVNLGNIAKIPRGEGRVFQLGTASIAVFHTRDGSVFATQSTCPHKGGPLADGVVGAQKVICPLHSFLFDLATGEPIGNSCSRLQTYKAAFNDEGEVLVGVDGATESGN
jgi:nitrite reductase (NADH) small subunit